MDADAFGARSAVIIGDTWQWTPFIFIVLLAALEGVPREPIEAALVDGANRVAGVPIRASCHISCR